MSGDRLAQIEKRAIDALDTNGYGFGYEHMGDMWRDMEPLCRDVLALVEIAKAARDITESIADAEGFRYVGSEDDIDMLDALSRALARLDSGATEQKSNSVLMDAADQQAIARAGLPVRCCENWPECSHVLGRLDSGATEGDA